MPVDAVAVSEGQVRGDGLLSDAQKGEPYPPPGMQHAHHIAVECGKRRICQQARHPLARKTERVETEEGVQIYVDVASRRTDIHLGGLHNPTVFAPQLLPRLLTEASEIFVQRPG